MGYGSGVVDALLQGLPERVVGPIVLPILKALAYLHKHDIVHRDVKARPTTPYICPPLGYSESLEACKCCSLACSVVSKD